MFLLSDANRNCYLKKVRINRTFNSDFAPRSPVHVPILKLHVHVKYESIIMEDNNV